MRYTDKLGYIFCISKEFAEWVTDTSCLVRQTLPEWYISCLPVTIRVMWCRVFTAWGEKERRKTVSEKDLRTWMNTSDV